MSAASDKRFSRLSSGTDPELEISSDENGNDDSDCSSVDWVPDARERDRNKLRKMKRKRSCSTPKKTKSKQQQPPTPKIAKACSVMLKKITHNSGLSKSTSSSTPSSAGTGSQEPTPPTSSPVSADSSTPAPITPVGKSTPSPVSNPSSPPSGHKDPLTPYTSRSPSPVPPQARRSRSSSPVSPPASDDILAKKQEGMVKVVMKMEDMSGDYLKSMDTIEADIKTGTVNGGKEENNNLFVNLQSVGQQRIILNGEISDDETSEVVDVVNSEKIQLKKEMKSDPDPGEYCIQLMAVISKLNIVNKRQKEDLVKSEKLCQLKDEQINLQKGQIKLQEGRIKLLEQELKLEKPEKKNPVVYDLD